MLQNSIRKGYFSILVLKNEKMATKFGPTCIQSVNGWNTGQGPVGQALRESNAGDSEAGDYIT